MYFLSFSFAGDTLFPIINTLAAIVKHPRRVIYICLGLSERFV